MKSTTPLFILAMLLFLVSKIQSQDLQIQHGNKTKTFKVGHLIRVDLQSGLNLDCKKCTQKYMTGRLLSYSNDSISLRLKVEAEPIINPDKQIGESGRVFRQNEENSWPVIAIPSSSVIGITKQGTKNWKPVNDGDLCGSAFVLVGLLSLTAALYAEGEENSDALVGAGATMTGLGLAMITVFNRKTYYLQNPSNTNKKSKSKPWNFK
jgi:hypothetical protein